MVGHVRVSATSQATKVAGAIAGILRDEPSVEVQAIGAHAVNQAIKALAVARSYLVDDGWDLHAQPSFVTIDSDGGLRSAMILAVHRSPLHNGEA
jgi:stage V sporulation protein S